MKSETPQPSGSDVPTGDSVIQNALEEIDSCQSEIDGLNEKSSEEILQVEMRYNELRKPHYAKRSDIIAKIPNFWITTFMNHPQLSLLLNEEEQRVMQHMKNLNVEEFDDIKNGYKIVLSFDSNPYFENGMLVKEYHLGANGDPKVVVTPIKWKPNKNFLPPFLNDKETRKRRATDSFFSWFTDTKNITMDEIADVLKDEIWPNPLQYYLLPEVEEENGEEEGDDEEDEDEDNGNEEEDEEEIDDDDES